ncbi:hypothetical protein B0H66DRAFT_489395 [Apodospora peruviana]|uniref:Peptidase S54 rhomboid domain-containing protein n=1 Tax=Apodospora peruviana TaxID=516989 RepID=A0AAE0IT89_9PEZI|nr:hypothetical protein B0H66DRAFT_489395 [Apodospora peruviana]
MNTPIGVNAFRSGVQIAAQQFSRQSSCKSRFLVLVAPSRRYLSSLLEQQPQQSQCSRNVPRKCHGPACLPQRPLLGLRTLKIKIGSQVITHYVYLPPDYRDEVGLPFLRRDLNAQEVLALFGPSMSTFVANQLLKILHGRRVAGTLEDPEVQINTLAYSRQEQKIALDYLRKNVPVDEVTNAGLRAEDELARLEAQTRGDGAEAPATAGAESNSSPLNPSKFQIYKEGDAEKSQPAPSVYGNSAFDAIRARNTAKYHERMWREAEEKRKREEEMERQNPGALQKIDATQSRQMSPRMHEWQKKGQSDLEAPPEMKAWERLLPSTLVILLAMGLLAAYAEYYRPPRRRNRLWPDIPPAAATVSAMIGIYLLVFACWKTPPMWKLLNRYFIVTTATPKPLAFFGATFSHQKFFSHLLPHIVALWFFGTRLHDEIGRGAFIATYVSAGTFGFLSSVGTLVLRGNLAASTLGASGAIYGVLAAYMWLHRSEYFKVFGLPPDPMQGVQGLGFLGLAIGLNVAMLFRSVTTHNVDVVSHFGGMAVGILAAHLVEKKKEVAGRPQHFIKPVAARTDVADKDFADKVILEKKVVLEGRKIDGDK